MGFSCEEDFKACQLTNPDRNWLHLKAMQSLSQAIEDNQPQMSYFGCQTEDAGDYLTELRPAEADAGCPAPDCVVVSSKVHA